MSPRPTGSARPRPDRIDDRGPVHWFEPLADHLGAAYDRYSFTRGTAQETAFLVEALRLSPGDRVLDVGCGTGRHARLLAAEGIEVVGVDVSAAFLTVATSDSDATFVRGDARRLPVATGAFDAVVSLCQGGFGLTGGPAAASAPPGTEPDAVVADEWARVLRPGGQLALTAFAAYFAVRDLGGQEAFDAGAGVLRETTTLRAEDGRTADHEMWTTCYTPRELRLLLGGAGFDVGPVWSVRPGRYATDPPDLDHPELLAVATKHG